jgi:LPXTG-site transpeptidase (sortase) family protein
MQSKMPTRQNRFIFSGLLFSVLSFILCGSVLANSVGFTDVPKAHPNFEAIQYVQDQAIVEGYPDGTFKPDSPINRAEFTKIIIEAYDQGQAEGGNCFPDVGSEWFSNYVCSAKTLNLIVGYPDGNFYPANDINFVEVAKILAIANGSTVTPDPAIWYKPYVEKLAESNAIPTSIASLTQKVTRGEMAEMIYRLKANVTDAPSKTYQELVIENATPQEQASLGLPVRLQIPAIQVDAALEYVGLTPQGAVGVPTDPANAAWYDLGPQPGDVGSAVITGHINWYYGAVGVFANLSKVKPGDKIIVQDVNGAAISFVVRESRVYDAAADAVDVFSSTDGKAHLNLITCDGVWVKSAKQYSERLVVFADRE